MNKTATIFATLTARYGKPQPKDGQEFQAVAQSYESALGAYSLPDLAAACSAWMSSTKYPRWPEPAELLEILRSFGAKPEAQRRELPAHIQQAQGDAGNWYRGLIRQPLPENAFPFGWDDALAVVLGIGKGQNIGKSFAWVMTRAWLDGVIPNGFDQKAAAYFADMQVRKQHYLNAVRTHGAVQVHEGRIGREP